jgi:amidase
MTPLEIGSDIGGSIRVPAAYCGLYGHRPSETAVPRSGSYPFADSENPAIVMGVQGPLARSAVDMEMLFDVVAGPGIGERVGWRLDLPPARGEQLSDLRVAIMPTLDIVQPSADMHAKVDELAVFLDKAGATVGEAMPDIDRSAYLNDYLTLLAVITSLGESRSEREKMASETAGTDLMAAMATGYTIDAMDYVMLLGRRESSRAAWREFFNDWDVLVCPSALDAAFKHQSGPQSERMLALDDTEVPYMLNIVYPMWAIFTGQPATAFPAGLNSAGLPLGLQAIGPYLEDRTTIRFAQCLEREWYGFERPPGY